MALEIKVPTLGESVTEATVGQWLKKQGDAVARDEPLVELETDKVTIEVPAPAAGRLEKIAVKDGETVAVGALLATLAEGATGKAAPINAGPEKPQPRAEPKAEAQPAKAPPPRPPKPAEPAPKQADRRHDDAARAVGAKLMAEKGVSPDDVAGSGKRGQVLKGDVLAALDSIAKPAPARRAAGAARPQRRPTKRARSA